MIFRAGPGLLRRALKGKLTLSKAPGGPSAGGILLGGRSGPKLPFVIPGQEKNSPALEKQEGRGVCVWGAVCAQPSALARRSFSLQPRGLFVVALPIFGTSFFAALYAVPRFSYVSFLTG